MAHSNYDNRGPFCGGNNVDIINRYIICDMGLLKDVKLDTGLKVPVHMRSEPQRHKTASWQHSNGSSSKYIDLDDRHLVNIYYVIQKNISYYEDMLRIGEFSAIDQLELFYKQNIHASFEIYKRGLYVQKKEGIING